MDQLTPSGAFPTDEDVTLTYTVTNHLPSTVCAANVDIQLPEGFTASSQSCDASNGGPNATCGDLDELGVTEDYIAMGVNGEVVITIVGRLTYHDDDPVIVSGRVTPGAGQGDKHPLDNYDSVTTNIAQAAILNDQTVYVLPDVPRTIDVLDGATPGSSFIVPSTAVIVSAPGNITATMVDGDLTIMLPEGVEGPVTIIVAVEDADGQTSAPATITVLQSLPPEVSDIEIWVAEDAGIVTVPIVSNELGEVFTTTLETPPAKGSAVVQNNIVTVTPEAPPANLGYYIVGVEACNTVLDPANCKDIDVTVVYNDYPTMNDVHRSVAPGQTQTVEPNADEGEVGAIDASSLNIVHTSSTEAQGTCSVEAGRVKYVANPGATIGETDTCVATICEQRPVGVCVTADFTFEIDASFNVTDDSLATIENVALDIKTETLLSNDGGTDDDTFVLVGTPDSEGAIATTQGGTVIPNEDGDGYVYTPSEGFVGEDTFQYNICSAFDGSVCEDVLVTVTVKTTPDAVDSTVWVVTGTPHVEVDLDEGYTGDDPIDSVIVISVSPEDDDNNAPGTVTVAGAMITFTPNDSSAPAVYEVDVELCDADALCTEVTVTIIYNDPPIAGTPMAAIPEGVEGHFPIPFNGIIAGTTPGEIDGGWDESSVAVSNDAGGPFGESSVDLGGASCAMVDGALVYTVSDSSLTASPTCFVQVCELNPGPAGIDATDRACTVLELTPEFGDHADVLITGPADNSETEDTTPTVTGTGQPGTEVTITVDGEPAGTVAVDENGNWSWTPEDSLGLGEHTIVAKGENGSEDQITLTVIDDRSPLTPDPDVALTGGRMFGCVSTDESTPTPALLALFVGLGLVLRRRKTARR